MTTCNRCGGVLPATATICHHCGTPVMGAAFGSNAAGSMGARQRAQEKWGSSLLPQSGPLSGFPPSPPPGSMNQNYPQGPAGQGPSAPNNNWRATSLIDPAQLPDWLNPATSGPLPRLGEGNRGPQAGPPSAPRTPRPGAGAPPQAGPSLPPPTPRQPASPRQQMPGASPYNAGGRRATDDLFTASSLIDQTQLPDWLTPRAPRPQKPAAPGESDPRRRSGPLSGPRPNLDRSGPQPSLDRSGPQSGPQPNLDRRPQDPGRDAHLPDWLRAMDPGAPPDLSNLNSGPLRSGGRPPASSYRAPMPETRGPGGNMAPGSDPFSVSRVDAMFPLSEGFGPGAEPSSMPGRAPTGNSDPFAPRSPFHQPPSQQPFSQQPFHQPPSQSSRPGDSFPGTSRNQGFPPLEAPLSGGAGMPEAWRAERRSSHPYGPPSEGFSASSLIDKTELPEWLNGPEQSASAAPRPAEPPASFGPRSFGQIPPSEHIPRTAAQPPSSASPAASSGVSPFDGASLVDEEALPDWLRSSRETEPLPLPFTVSDSVVSGIANSDYGAKRTPTPIGGEMNTTSDDDAVPDWLQQVYSEAHVPPLYEGKPPATSGPQKISGSDLLDDRSVPTWIREATQTSPLANISDILAFTPPASQPENRAYGGAQPSTPLASSGPLSDSLSARSLVEDESLPGWLRTVGDEEASATQKGSSASAYEPGAAPQGGASGFFSATELVDTQALPVWLKSQGAQAEQTAAAQPKGQPGVSDSPSGIFSAAELVDTHALPTWLRDQEPNGTPEPSAGAAPAAPLGGVSGIFSAAELVDTHALPTWLKAQEQAGNASPAVSSASGVFEAVRPPSSKMTPMPAGFAAQQTGAFSAAELVDTKALPTWLKDAGPGAGAQSSQSGAKAPAREAESKMSASELVDTGSLPVWLRGAEGASGSLSSPGASAGSFSAARGTPPSAAASDQTGGFSAASLVDPQALPEWLRPAQSGALNPGAVSSQSGPASDWGRDPHEQSGFSAAALIDRNELPEWMQGQEGVQRPGAQSMEDDAEEGPQARVPRRPRLSTEPDRAPSQAAASVFSSVLGPTAGEDQRNQPSLGGRPTPLGDMSPPERSNPFGQLSAQAQAQNRAGTEMSGWNQSSGSPRGSGTLRGAEGEQGRGFDQSSAGEWPGSFGSQEPLERQRPGYRALGPLSEQRGRPAFQPDESEEMGPPPRRPAEQPGRSSADAGFGMAGSQRPDPFAGRGAGRSFNEPPAGPQGRGAPGNFGYQQEGYDGWEGGPGYDPDFAGDDEAGPPSGMFAKLKRMLGFGR